MNFKSIATHTKLRATQVFIYIYIYIYEFFHELLSLNLLIKKNYQINF